MMGSEVVVPATTTVEQEEEHWLPSVVAGVTAPPGFVTTATLTLSTQSAPVTTQPTS